MKAARPLAAVLAAASLVAGGWLVLEDGGREQLPDVGSTLLDGTTGTTGQLRGKVVLIHFRATDCAACVHEMPRLAATYEEFRARGYETLAVAMSHDKPHVVANYAQARKLPFFVAYDGGGAMARQLGSVLVNRRGEIVKRYVGEPDFVALGRLVDRLLAES
jgi:peroxiredoxin